MAQKVNVVVTDDFDGAEGASTVRFGLDGAEYEVDLKPEHEKIMRDFLDAYIGVGRKTATGRRMPSKVRKASGAEAGKIREWARANGYEVNERGRVPANIVDAYHASRGATAPAPAPAELTPEQLDSAPAAAPAEFTSA